MPSLQVESGKLRMRSELVELGWGGQTGDCRGGRKGRAPRRGAGLGKGAGGVLFTRRFP